VRSGTEYVESHRDPVEVDEKSRERNVSAWLPPPGKDPKHTTEVFGGTEEFDRSPWLGVPRDLQASFLLWLAALAAGVAETIVGIIDSLSAGSSSATDIIFILFIRLVVTAVLVYIVAQMCLGKNWARVTLAALLGEIGTLSLVFDPVSWLVEGNSLRELLRDADFGFVVLATIRVLHLAAVLGALVFMFRPSANAYFQAAIR
jgi:hypothetical protein